MKQTIGSAAVLGLALAAAITLAGCQKAATNAPANVAAANTASPAAGQSVAAADPAAAADAKAFLEGVYAHYKTSKNSTFQPFDADAKNVLDPDLIALMAADTKALNGELGDIDGDWLCDCQDYTSITATITVLSASADTAKATSDFKDVDDTSPKPRHDTFDLVKTPAGWRIHDMGAADQPSLRKVLSDEIARLKHGGKPVSGD